METANLKNNEIRDSLIQFIKPGHEDWNQRAIPCFERLERICNSEKGPGPDGLRELEKSIRTQNSDANCIIIECPTFSGTFMVLDKSYFPPGASCLLWRWPYLKNSTRSIQPIDKYQKDRHHIKAYDCISRQKMCINPFHYKISNSAMLTMRLECLNHYMKKSNDFYWNEIQSSCMYALMDLLDDNGLENLMNAVATTPQEGISQTECVILITPISKRGIWGIRIGKFYYWPHVISCKTWNWPYMAFSVHGIKPIGQYEGSAYHYPTGEDSGSTKGDPGFKLCVNPTHYRKIM